MMGKPWGPWERPEWARGQAFKMPLDFSQLYSVVRVIGDDQPQLEPSLRQRIVLGTGFLMAVPSETTKNSSHVYVITAAHVIENQTAVQIEVPIPQPTGGMYPPVVIDSWRRPLPHVDLALARLQGATDQQVVSTLDEQRILPNQVVPHLRLADVVEYVGILTPLDRPMVRSGTVGAIDQQNLPVGAYDYVGHLIDCRSYGGFSGSPVFASFPMASLEPTHILDNKPFGELYYGYLLAGMFAAHLSDSNEWAASRYGVGVMVRGVEIREALMSEELRQERRGG
jgi:hypothetical protein